MTIIQIKLHLHATSNQNGLKIIFLYLCASKFHVQYIRRNFRTYLSRDMDTCICMHGVPWRLNSKKLKKKSETRETLVYVMSCHQDDVVKKLACLTKVWTHTPHKHEQLTRRLMVPGGNNACLMTNKR